MYTIGCGGCTRCTTKTYSRRWQYRLMVSTVYIDKNSLQEADEYV